MFNATELITLRTALDVVIYQERHHLQTAQRGKFASLAAHYESELAKHVALQQRIDVMVGQLTLPAWPLASGSENTCDGCGFYVDIDGPHTEILGERGELMYLLHNTCFAKRLHDERERERQIDEQQDAHDKAALA